MSGVEYIESHGRLLATIIAGSHCVDQSQFFTKDEDALQLGLLAKASGDVTRAHRHPKREFSARSGLECLVLKKGRAKLYIYDTDSGAVIERELRALDTVLLYDCGHRLDYLEDTVLIELKLGPRRVSGDKVLL